MFLLDKKTKIMCLDFQLVYDIDAKIHLDFYADGLCDEPEVVFGHYNIFNKIAYGFVSVNKDEYDKYQNSFLKECTKLSNIVKHSRRMVDSINIIKNSSILIERKITTKVFNFADIEAYYQDIRAMMSYRRISDRYQLEIENSSNTELSMAYWSIECPSYLVIFNNELRELKRNLSSTNINKFIYNYGFLGNFGIGKCEFETEEGLMRKLENINLDNIELRKKSNLNEFEKYKHKLNVYRDIVFYEEYRHYYQLRALRNFRLIFELLGVDIYNSTLATIKRLLS